MSKKPSEAQLRVLADVGNGRVTRTGPGWTVASQPVRAADIRHLEHAWSQRWIRTEGEPHVGESRLVRLTYDGQDVLAAAWPNWTPRTTS